MKDENIICKICGKEYQHLGSHIFHTHKMLAREYKAQFGLDYNYPLISAEVKEKKQLRFEENRKKYLLNLFKAGNKYRFKKGVSTHPRISRQTRERLLEQAKGIQSSVEGLCPICKVRYKHLQSHLFNKHGLLSINKQKGGVENG